MSAPSEPTPNSRPLRLADYYLWNTIADVALSPDGRRAVYVLRAARKAKNDHYTNLYMVQTDGSGPAHRLTRTLSRDSAPAFSPDGRFLAFLSTREHELEVAERVAADAKEGKGKGKDEKPKTQVWVFDLLCGGEPRQVTTLSEGVSGFDWAPDSAQLVLAARTPTPAQQKYLDAIRGDERGPVQLRRMQHKRDGGGFVDEVHIHLHVVNVATREIKQITDGPCDETDPRWSPDGEWIAFGSNRTGLADANRRRDLWVVKPDGSECRRLTLGDLSADAFRWSPDARRIAFTANPDPENAYKMERLMLIDLGTAQPVANLAECVGLGWTEIGGIVPDLAPGADPVLNARRYPVPAAQTPCQVLTANLDAIIGGRPAWLDDQTIVVLAGDRGQTRLVRANLSGEAAVTYPTDRFQNINWAVTAAGTLVVCLDSPLTGPDLFALPAADPAGADPVRLTNINAAVVPERDFARYERVEFTGANGETVEALVAVPHGWTPAAGPLPLIASIHGGPMAADIPNFNFARQYWAGMGYLVIMVNYHGSISYGEAFCESIRSKWGPMEHQDLEAGVEKLIAMGWADRERLFVTGFSYGGIMTNWAVGHTDMFKAAVSEHGVWNYSMTFGTDDCQLWWQDDLGMPWQNPEGYAATSPASGVANVKTPTLIMAGQEDWRCPLTESEQMYLSLKKRGVPTELVVWQGEWHAISKPRRAIDRIRRISAWFAKYGGLPLNDETAEGYPDLD